MNMRKTLTIIACAAAVAVFGQSTPAIGFQPGLQFQVNESVDSLEIITGSSRRLKFGYNVPELMVENPGIIQATPVAPNEILISGVKPGISTITVSDPNKNLQTIRVQVTVDTRELQNAYSKHFADSQIKVDALQTGVIVSGYVARADQIENVMAVARDYFPSNVINHLQVNGSQNIAIKVKVYEVSRSKLRKLGVDWSLIGDDYGIVSSVSDLIQTFSLEDGTVTGAGQNLTFGVVGNNTAFNAFIEALEQRNVAKLLDQPTLVAQNGRPAEFLSGGEVPIQVASGLGTNSIEFRPFGTKLDIVPIVHGAGQLTLEVRAEVSEIARDLSGESGVPGFRVRRVNTGVKMKAGHTLALAGDYREIAASQTRGIPWLMDSPFLGPLFRAESEETNETELVFLITPRFISEVEPNRLPSLGPGQLTQSPSDREFFQHGFLEVPKCQDDCPVNDRFDDPAARPVNQLLPDYPVEMINDPVGAPAVTPPLETSYRFPSKESSRRSNAGETTRQAKNGFDWPTQVR
jgi:pilus assembly protein CpaC